MSDADATKNSTWHIRHHVATAPFFVILAQRNDCCSDRNSSGPHSHRQRDEQYVLPPTHPHTPTLHTPHPPSHQNYPPRSSTTLQFLDPPLSPTSPPLRLLPLPPLLPHPPPPSLSPLSSSPSLYLSLLFPHVLQSLSIPNLSLHFCRFLLLQKPPPPHTTNFLDD